LISYLIEKDKNQETDMLEMKEMLTKKTNSYFIPD